MVFETLKVSREGAVLFVEIAAPSHIPVSKRLFDSPLSWVMK